MMMTTLNIMNRVSLLGKIRSVFPPHWKEQFSEPLARIELLEGGSSSRREVGSHFTNRLILLCRLSRSSFLLRNFLIEFLKKSIRSRLASALESLRRTFSFKSILSTQFFFQRGWWKVYRILLRSRYLSNKCNGCV